MTVQKNGNSHDMSIAVPNNEPIVKLCALYKPILRRFRAFMRKKFDRKRRPSLYQHWSTDVYMSQVRTFMVDILSLPSQFINAVDILKMLTLLFPCSIKKVFPNHYKIERLFLVRVFKENS